MALKQEIISAFIILLIACVLFGCSAFMRFRRGRGTEGFEAYAPEGMCGVDLPPCSFGTRCINGFCKTEATLPISASSGLPVKPEGYIRL